eukprot:1500242-Pyramimonas_sp.AAC.1
MPAAGPRGQTVVCRVQVAGAQVGVPWRRRGGGAGSQPRARGGLSTGPLPGAGDAAGRGPVVPRAA